MFWLLRQTGARSSLFQRPLGEVTDIEPCPICVRACKLWITKAGDSVNKIAHQRKRFKLEDLAAVTDETLEEGKPPADYDSDPEIDPLAAVGSPALEADADVAPLPPGRRMMKSCTAYGACQLEIHFQVA